MFKFIDAGHILSLCFKTSVRGHCFIPFLIFQGSKYNTTKSEKTYFIVYDLIKLVLADFDEISLCLEKDCLEVWLTLEKDRATIGCFTSKCIKMLQLETQHLCNFVLKSN